MARRLTRIFLAAPSAAKGREKFAALGFAPFSALGFALGLALGDDGMLNLGDGVALGFGPTEALGLDLADAPSSPHFLAAPPLEGPAPAHPNGVLGVKSLAILADQPADHAELLSLLTGQREMIATSSGLDLALANARLEVLTPPAFAFRYGATAPSHPFRLAGLTLTVKNPPETEAFLRRNGFAPRQQAGRLLIGDIGGLTLAVAPLKSEF